MVHDVKAHCTLQFQILFTVEYGMDREELETLNLYIKTSEPHTFSEEVRQTVYRVHPRT
jgi:hypothetical protein